MATNMSLVIAGDCMTGMGCRPEPRVRNDRFQYFSDLYAEILNFRFGS